MAMPVAMLALVVVLPTPPLPEVTTTTFEPWDTWASFDDGLRFKPIERAIRRTAKFF